MDIWFFSSTCYISWKIGVFIITRCNCLWLLSIALKNAFILNLYLFMYTGTENQEGYSLSCLLLLVSILRVPITYYFLVQKQPYRGNLKERCSENMHQIYRRTTMQKSNLNKVPLHGWIPVASAWVLSCKFAAYFQNPFS